jgi:copper transport protein
MLLAVVSLTATWTVMSAVSGAGVAPVASAQSETDNELVSSEPGDGGTVGTSPDELVFTFAEPLGPDDLFTAPVTCGTALQNTGIPEVGNDRTSVTVEVLTPFPRGACTVSWLLRDSLGETIDQGLIAFSVQTAPVTADDDDTGDPADGTDDSDDGAADPAPAAPPPAASDQVTETDGGTGGALWLGRVISTTAILALFGALVLIGTAWPEGPEYVITLRFVRSLWVVAFVGTVLFVVAFTAEASDRAFGGSLSPTAWLDLFDAGWAGRAALARLLLVVAAGWVAFRPERVIDPTTQLPAFVIPALAVVAVGLARTGGDYALIGSALGIAHALAAAVWFGGALVVARVVVAGPGEEDLVHAVRGFNRMSAPAIAVTIVTGVLQMFRLVGGELFTSSHGRVLLLKTVVVAAMVFVAVTARQMVAVRLRRADEMSVPAADRFRRSYTAEAGIGVVVLALSGWLLALQPAQIDDRATYEVERQFTDPASGLDVIVSLTPSAVGLNGLRVEVEAPQEGISNLVVAFIPPTGSEAPGIEQTIPLTGAGTAVLDREVGLPFDVPGTWTMQLSGSTATGAVTDARTPFPVTGDGDDGISPDVTGTDETVTTDPVETPPVVTVEIDIGNGDNTGDDGNG